MKGGMEGTREREERKGEKWGEEERGIGRDVSNKELPDSL